MIYYLDKASAGSPADGGSGLKHLIYCIELRFATYLGRFRHTVRAHGSGVDWAKVLRSRGPSSCSALFFNFK